MKRAILLLALVAAPLLAQPSPDDQIARVVQLKYADPNSVGNLLSMFGVNVRSDQRMMALAISGRRSAVEAAETAIKQLDVPGAAQKDIELTVYFVMGTSEPPAAGSAVPPDLQPAMTALKQTFAFKNYALLDSLALRARTGSGASTTGQLSEGRMTQFSVRSVNIEGDGATIRVDRLRANLRVPKMVSPNKTEFLDSGIETETVDIKEGQKLVVGRSSLEGPSKALFLVLIARVVQ